MDSSHVSLVSLSLPASSFDLYRCDRHISLGFNSSNMAKIVKFMEKDDIVTMKADDDGDTLTLMFENPKAASIADFGMYKWNNRWNQYHYLYSSSLSLSIDR